MPEKKNIDWAKVDWSVGPARLARLLGCSRQSVYRARTKLRGGGRKTIDWNKVPGLGELPDKLIADALGCDIFNVAAARRRRGKPPVLAQPQAAKE